MNAHIGLDECAIWAWKQSLAVVIRLDEPCCTAGLSPFANVRYWSKRIVISSMQETSKRNANIYELIHQCKIVQKQKHFFNKHVVINMLSLYKSSMVQRLGYLAFTEAARVRLPVGEWHRIVLWSLFYFVYFALCTSHLLFKGLFWGFHLFFTRRYVEILSLRMSQETDVLTTRFISRGRVHTVIISNRYINRALWP